MNKRNIWRFAGSFGATMLVSACTFGVNLAGFFDGKGDATGADGSVPTDAQSRVDRFAPPPGDAGAEADVHVRDAADAGSSRCPLPNFVLNGDFAVGGLGWAGAATTSAGAHAAAARNGASGYRICGSGTYGASYGFDPALPAGSYQARFWYRATPDAGRASVGLSLAGEDELGSDVNLGNASPAWKCGEYQKAQELAFSYMNILGSAAGASCLDLDDVELFQVPDGGTLPAECICP
jgi:hypothetical protein